MLGICVVYLVNGPGGYGLLGRSIAQIKRTTRGAYRLYGCCPDGDGETLRLMEVHGIAIQPVGERTLRGGDEHAFLLDLMTDKAFSDGCTHVATFDMDSWPIVEGWDEFYKNALTPRAPVASIVRTEAGDNFPFAAFTILARDFWAIGASSFSVKQRAVFPEEIVNVSSRPKETGSGILAQLIRDGQSFLRLERSNRWNMHPLMGALYDDTMFHLGAVSRQPNFLTDGETYR